MDSDLSLEFLRVVEEAAIACAKTMGQGDRHKSDQVAAAAMRCLNGEIFARLVVAKPAHEARCRAMGITDFKRVYRAADLAPGERVIFAATGVTDGSLMRGV